jgi:predicted TPR repeat methyltransferase
MHSTLDDILALHKAGQLSDAEQGYVAWLENHPNDVTALNCLGMLYAEQHQLDKAQSCFEMAVKLKSADPVLQLNLANIFKTKNRYPQAEAILLECIKDHPDYAAAYNNLGTVYFAQGRLQEALDAYHHAIRLQANYIDAYYNAALTLNKQKKPMEAMTIFRSLIELAPEHVGAHFQLGCLLMQQNQYRQALDEFAAIEKNHPHHVETQINMATCCLKLDWINEAKIHYLRALEITSDDEQVLFNLGVLSMQQGHIDDAIHYYLQAIAIQPDFFEAQNNLGTSYLAKRDKQNALRHFQEALRLQPDNVAVRHTISILTQTHQVDAPPAQYVRTLFDSYADHYDAHLQQVLHYQVPLLLIQLLEQHAEVPSHGWDVLDLGCGTGLCGEYFHSVARTLIGVDLSANMLEQAEKKHLYDKLIELDAEAYLTSHPASTDVIVAGDVLVYMGNLTELMPLVAAALRPDGYFVFNAELSQDKDYVATASGRYAHRKNYLDKLLAENKLAVLAYHTAEFRNQDGAPIVGHLYLAKKS